jgi:activator of HSP90 ATPase
MKSKTVTIKQKVLIPAAPEEVYAAFTDSKKHSAFTGSKATGKPIVGGKFTAWDGYILGKHLELEKGKRIVQEWTTTEWPEDSPPSRIELVLKKADGDTEITFTQTGVPADQAKEIETGWVDFYWEPLRDYFKKRKRVP